MIRALWLRLGRVSGMAAGGQAQTQSKTNASGLVEASRPV